MKILTEKKVSVFGVILIRILHLSAFSSNAGKLSYLATIIQFTIFQPKYFTAFCKQITIAYIFELDFLYKGKHEFQHFFLLQEICKS